MAMVAKWLVLDEVPARQGNAGDGWTRRMVYSPARLRATPLSLSYSPFLFVPSFAPARKVLKSGCFLRLFFACLPLSVACVQVIMGVLEHRLRGRSLGRPERGHFGGRTWPFCGARVPYCSYM